MAQFPKGFLWGAASASYQIEGGVKEGGRGESVWDAFSHTPGKVKFGDNGDTAADSYHRWREDVQLLKDMGLGAYRFSMAWPRIAPNGDDNWNPAGLAYYDGLVDALREAGIEPWVTLYHWDLPQALQNKGGWQNEDTARAYAAYAAKAAEHFKGRVTHWITFNEPQCFIGMGYGSGEHAPGLRLREEDQLLCWQNMLAGHRLAIRALRGIDGGNVVGLASCGGISCPATDSAEDMAAARQHMFPSDGVFRGFGHPQFLDPLCLGDSDGKPDFIGLNIYHGTVVRMGKNGPEEVPHRVGGARTAMDWPVVPQALEWGPRLVHERYGLPIYITENGLSCRDWVALDGKVHDPNRIDFLTRYLRALSAGIAAGADVRGYFHWALTDNFEWAEGYGQRFGLVYVDYPTGERIPKDSARWYRETAQNNGENI
ncbi:MAG: beta-glucosidase [Oscillospiraceae bacterium]|nr:beta-glucosidase [Oscillospiraceae bacterium]